MKIGLTYDLRSEYLAQGYGEEETAELDREDTIDAIAGAVQRLGHETSRIGSIKTLIPRLAAGERWDLVFNIAEGLHGTARESQVPAVLDVYQIPYTFSDPLVLAVALHKGLTKHLVRAAGLPTADFAVVESLEQLPSHLPYPLFAKPVAEGTSKGVDSKSLVNSDTELTETVSRLLGTFRQPVLVERYLPGREFTVGIVGTGPEAEVLGTLEVLLTSQAEAGMYSYENKKSWEDRVTYRLVRGGEDEEVRRAEAIALSSWRALGCRDAGRVDLRSDAWGEPAFIEVNPLAGLNPEISDLAILARQVGVSYEALIARIVESASRRVNSSSTRPC